MLTGTGRTALNTTARRSIRTILATAGSLGGVVGIVGLGANAFAQTTEAQATQPAVASSVSQQLDIAASLLDQGKVVQARTMLLDLTTGSSSVSMGESEKARALALAANANRKFKALDSIEASLQTAETSIARGDLKLAIAQAEAVIDAPKATNKQVQEARTHLEAAKAKQSQIAPTIATTLDEALADVAAGRTSSAKAKLDIVNRSGVSLDATQSAKLNLAQMDLVNAVSDTGSLGMMQPGVVKRRPEPVPTPAQPAQPETQPASEPAPAAAPTQEVVPATPLEPAQPVEAPVVIAQAQPAAQPGNSDPIAAARQWQAQSLLAEADFAFNQNRFNEAVAKYNQLLSQFGDQLTAEQSAAARQRMSDAQVRLGNDATQGNLLDQVIQNNQVARQSAMAEFNNDLAQSEAALARDDTQRAREFATQARVRIGANRNVFTNEEAEGYGTQVDTLMGRIDAREAEVRTSLVQKQADDAKRDAESRAKAQAEDRARKLNESIDRVRALQVEQKYDEALQVVQSQILFLDPTNPTGLLLRDVLADAIVWRQYDAISRRNTRSWTEQDLQNEDARFAPPDIVDYPSNWPAISEKRGTPVAFAEAEENRRALAALQNKRVPVKFEETPLESALSFLQAVSQLNVDVDWASLEDQGIDRGTTVNLNLTNVTLETVLNRVTEKVSPPGDTQGGAGWTINDGVVQVASKQVINRQRTLAIYDIRDLIVEVPNYDNAPELDLQQALQASRRGGGGGGQSPFQDNNGQDIPRRTLAERTQEIIDLITTNVDNEGWRENGGDTGYIQQLSGLLVITNTPANHRSIHGLLSKLRDYRALQVNVETRFLLVTQDFFEQFGVDLDVYLNANSNVVRQARATRPTTRASDFFDFQRNPGYSPLFPANGTGQARSPLGDPWSPIGIGQNSLGLTESLIGTDFAQDVFQTAPAMGIAGQFLDDIQVDFMVKATQADRRTVSLTAPRLTFTNGQISNIYVATQVSFVSDLTPITSESAAAFDPQPNAVVEGVVMQVDGTVSADRKYVTMNVDAAVSRVDSITNLPVTAIAGGQLVQSGATQSFIQLPQVTVTRVRTTVTVPDQGTLLLGGQRLTTEQEVESGVPILSKIPVLNRLFTNRVATKEESTLLILVKPTVLIQSENEEKNFPGLADSLRNPFGG
ncbi:MAG: hypothetical protein U0640_06620 [Phycisphaerales bacterium]